MLLLLAPAPLAAQREDATVRVKGLEFGGVRRVDEGTLRSVLATKAPGWLPWSDKPVFNRVQFEADLHRIRAFYVDRGFPDAQVSSFDIELNEEGTEVVLRVEVEEGEPITVSELRLEGFDEVPERRLRGLRRRLPIGVGQPFDRASIATAREMLADVMRDYGYPYPRVSASIDKGASEHEVSIILTASPGERAYFGETTIVGETSVGESFIRRSLLFEPGDVYERSRIQETQRKLYG
ncbi:MAG TPA: POTRA domain-containing protein, partial [Vicinamibacterales bacterium]|nr:POTRA domain-containing protein [Vicinamibacterales bacterium]